MAGNSASSALNAIPAASRLAWPFCSSSRTRVATARQDGAGARVGSDAEAPAVRRVLCCPSCAPTIHHPFFALRVGRGHVPVTAFDEHAFGAGACRTRPDAFDPGGRSPPRPRPAHLHLEPRTPESHAARPRPHLLGPRDRTTAAQTDAPVLLGLFTTNRSARAPRQERREKVTTEA